MAEPLLPAPTARIALIIDDLGNRLGDGLRAVNLPGQVNLSILPHTPHAHQLAWRAHAQGKEVLLHLPMASNHHNLLGPGGLEPDLSHDEMAYAVKAALESVPHVRGVNNHMGSLLTRQAQAMQWLMQTLHQLKVGYFLDSRTTPDSVAESIARQAGLPTLRRHVFLDHYRDRASIEQEFDRLVKIAQTTGRAVGIAHPLPLTLDVLERRLPELRRQGIALVPVSSLAVAAPTVTAENDIALESHDRQQPDAADNPAERSEAVN